MRRSVRTTALGMSLLLVLSFASAQAFAGTHARFDARKYLRTHGYLPLRGVATLRAAKAYAERAASRLHSPAAARLSPHLPTAGASWKGIASTQVTPPDPNGAIGPSSYLEIVNINLAIYNRSGGLVTKSTLQALTGRPLLDLSDPMILWDPDTQRFYYNVWNTSNATMQWGFSKSSNPTSIPGSFCNYNASFGYPVTSFPDYPKLGSSKKFLMIGVNFYPTSSSQAATESDLLWISKPQGTGTVTTCPAASTFKKGKFKSLKNQDGSQAFTPVPAIQTDPSTNGYVVASSDIECTSSGCPSGTKITVYQLKPSTADPTVPTLSAPHSMTVGSFTAPPSAPQHGSPYRIDTLDGRLTHAVSAIDPTNAGGAVGTWTSQTVLGGAGAEVKWYEIKPTPLTSPSLVQSGTISDPSLFVYNGAVSPDRTWTPGSASHGGSMAAGFTTSSSSTYVADMMVSKVGGGPQSGFVLITQSSFPDVNFGCQQLGFCRWGDYGGATPDPAADLSATNGEVWLTQQWTNNNDQTWNWEARP